MKMLVGVDGSEHAVDALEWALDRATPSDDLVVAVIGDDGVADRVRAVLDDAELDPAVRRLDAESPGSTLVSIAESEGFDEVVIGGGERSPMGKIRLGEMREFVVLNADVTVTLVR